MGILCAILSLPVSVLLIRWLIKKKTENPFEKGDVRRLIIAGMLSMVVAAVVTLLILCVRAYRLIGMDKIDDLFLLLLLASALLLVGLTVFMIIKINRWAKLKPVQELRSEGRAAD